MTVDQPRPSSGSFAGHNPSRHHSSFAAVALRVGGCLLIVSCLFASLANQAAVKSRLAGTGGFTSKHARVRRDIQLNSNNLTSSDVASHRGELGEISTEGLGKPSSTTGVKARHAPIDLVLPQFPTLQVALENSEVVAVYFGAAWCKRSAQVANRIDRILGSKLQQYAQAPAITATTKEQQKRRPLSLVYVSSDKTKLQFQDFVRNRHFTKVPFKSAERRLLKKHFKVCAKAEQERLQFQREHEIPYLLVFSGETRKIVSRKGVEDLKEYGLGVLDYWTDLVRGKMAIAK